LSRAAAPNLQPARVALSQVTGNSSREIEEGMSNTDVPYTVSSPNKVLLSLWRDPPFHKDVEALIVFLSINDWKKILKFLH